MGFWKSGGVRRRLRIGRRRRGVRSGGVAVGRREIFLQSFMEGVLSEIETIVVTVPRARCKFRRRSE